MRRRPSSKPARVAAWRAGGHRSLLTLPGTERLSDSQQRVRQAVLSGAPWVSPDLAPELERLVAEAARHAA